jgi:hypothetical protein
MKLSEAMREGAKLRPQSFVSQFQYVTGADGTIVLCSCALGAACEAEALSRGQDGPEAIIGRNNLFGEGGEAYIESKLFPYIWRPAFVNDGIEGKSIGGLILGMNDNKRLSREEIADRVEALGY